MLCGLATLFGGTGFSLWIYWLHVQDQIRAG